MDSLSQAVVSDENVLLVHPTLAVLYSRTSRSFTEMCGAIGGCPYVMLTNVVLAYNEYLLDQNAQLIDQIKLSVRNARWVAPHGGAGAEAARQGLAARVQLFENQALHALPNIFRYPAERAMFEEIVAQRGLRQRTEGFERFTRSLYELRKDSSDLAEREDTWRTNRLLLALAVLQLCGLFVAALAFDSFKGESLSGALNATRWALWCALAASFVIGIGVGASAFWRRRRQQSAA